MTMKKQKTLHRFAAVAAVLLAFCLVLATPAAADDTIDTWAELKSALETGGTVTLGGDIDETIDIKTEKITIDDTTTLDLNGKNLTVTYTGGGSIGMFNIANGHFTIKDTPGNGEINLISTKTDLASWNDAVVIVYVGSGSTVIIDCSDTTSLAIRQIYDLSGVYVADVYADKADSSFELKNGKLSSTRGGMRVNIRSDSYVASTYIKGGSITSYSSAIWIQQATTSDYPYSLIVTGGTLESTNNAPIGINALNSGPVSGTVKMDITISGGIIKGKPSNDSYPGVIAYSNIPQRGSETVDIENHKLTIEGGRFIFNEGATKQNIIGFQDSSKKLPTISITGGVFDVCPSETYVASGKVCVANDDGTFTVTDETHSISISASSVNFGTVTEGYSNVEGGDVSDVTITVTNDGNSKVTLQTPQYDGTKFIVGPYSDTSAEINPGDKVTFAISPHGALEAGTYTGDIIIQATPVESGDNSVSDVYDEEVITVTFTVIEKPENEETAIVPTLPPIGVEENEDGDVIITVPEETVSKEVLEGTSYLEIKTGEDASVTLMISGYSGENGQYTLGSEAEIAATYTPAEPTLNPEYEESTVVLGVVLELEKVNATLPVFSFDYDEETAGKVTSTYVKPLAMLKATHNAEEADADLKSVSLIFVVDKELYEKYEGKFFLYHVADNGEPEEVSGVPTIDSTTYEEDGLVAIIFTSDLGFSSYVLAVGTDSDGETGGEAPGITSSGSATDTGSGNYQYYPRSVPTDGIVDFGTSKVVTGIELPAGSDGTVTLNIKPTFAMPENGYYAFEIDAPGYNTDAKINGGLSFQIPVADLEAAGFTAEDIVLFHGTVGEDGKIVWEARPTNLVKNENGVAYYKAAINGCSPFYIGFVKDGSVVNTEVVEPTVPETPETPVTPDEPEVLPPVDEPETPEQPTESPAPILAVLAGLGAAVVLRRK